MHNPYLDENGTPTIDTEENRGRYELSQKQRAMERVIRKTKRQLVEKDTQINLVAEMDVREMLRKDYDKLAYRLTQQNAKYNDFCKNNGLTPQYERNKLADFGRRQEREANAGARRHKNDSQRRN